LGYPVEMTQLRKNLTLFGLTMIAIGSCIGSGIFVTPYEIVQAVPHSGLVLLVWALGGLVALTGALTFAELGGLFPKAGGVYVYLREAYGEWIAFLYGWIILLVVNTGALAALGVAFAEYLHFFLPEINGATKVYIAIATIVVLTAFNVLGVNYSQWLSNIFTAIKVLALFGIVIVGFIYYDPNGHTLNLLDTQTIPENLGSALLLGLIGVLWSFGGWHHASYLAGETIRPQWTVPRAMVLGAGVVTFSYLLVNLGYMLLLPLETIAGTERVAGDAVASVFPWGGQLVAIGISISIFGTIGIYTMSAPRIYFAMAKDQLFFRQLAYIHPRFQTPAVAMVVQAVWAILLLLFWGTFSNLITYVTFMDIIFMGMAGACVFIFRKKIPNEERPYRTWGYPVVPGVFVLICFAFVVNTLVQRPQQAWAGLIFVGLGSLAFLWFRKKRG
jgi:APA family basic amino acid/polyamine antiporter